MAEQETPNDTLDPTQWYEVVAGDTLSKIAKKFYGDPNLYPQIFEANRDQLSDPNKIQVGQKLRIP
jgi:nucleoid-associated protein YgaU